MPSFYPRSKQAKNFNGVRLKKIIDWIEEGELANKDLSVLLAIRYQVISLFNKKFKQLINGENNLVRT